MPAFRKALAVVVWYVSLYYYQVARPTLPQDFPCTEGALWTGINVGALREVSGVLTNWNVSFYFHCLSPAFQARRPLVDFFLHLLKRLVKKKVSSFFYLYREPVSGDTTFAGQSGYLLN
jgi:hypothetical protein